jgi:hypothetical protein
MSLAQLTPTMLLQGLRDDDNHAGRCRAGEGAIGRDDGSYR